MPDYQIFFKNIISKTSTIYEKIYEYSLFLIIREYCQKYIKKIIKITTFKNNKLIIFLRNPQISKGKRF